MKTIFNILDERRPALIWWLSVLVVIGICYAMFLFGNNVELMPLLAIPIVLASWYGGGRAGVFLALLTVISLAVTKWVVNSFENTLVYDSLVILFSYLFLAIIVTNFKSVYRVESVAADTDALTGVNSSRNFYSELANEILRSKRYDHTFSLAYIDIDNFKKINDKLGHATGDELLIEVSECMMRSLRESDFVARIGGDEFVCLFPETEQGEARAAILKTESTLRESMRVHRWDVSFSIGVVTFETLPDDVHEAVRLADELMYSVKSNKKNNIAYRVWRGTA